jgi:hypothetical protein
VVRLVEYLIYGLFILETAMSLELNINERHSRLPWRLPLQTGFSDDWPMGLLRLSLEQTLLLQIHPFISVIGILCRFTRSAYTTTAPMGFRLKMGKYEKSGALKRDYLQNGIY